MDHVIVQLDGHFLQGRAPLRIIEAHDLADVLPALAEVEHLHQTTTHWIVGGVTYEAAPAFDTALAVHKPLPTVGKSKTQSANRWQFTRPPLLRFAVFKNLTPIDLPAPSDPTDPSDALDWTPAVAEPDYLAAIRAIHDAIARGETYQVNYTVPFHADAPTDPLATFARLARAQRADYTFYAESDDEVICSVSPELFFRREANRVTCRPMKGTASRAPDSPRDLGARKTLLASAKERAENVMIVDMIRNDLGRVAATGTVRVPELFTVETYPTVHQLTSTVVADVPPAQASLPALFTALFPCASITGAPKVQTMGIIRDLEPAPRGWYCGALGVLAPDGRVQFNVAIRTLLINRAANTATYQAGGGITWDSVPEREWAECLTKTRVLDPPWPEFDLFETIRWVPGIGPMRLERHLDRLRRSCKYFGWPFPADAIRARLARFWEPGIHRLRLSVTSDGDVHLHAQPFQDAPDKSTAVIDTAPVNPASVFLYHKTSRRQTYNNARARHPDADDVILINTNGHATETTIGNLVAEIDGNLLTPPLAAGLLPGILRGELLDRGDLIESPLTPADLHSASRLWRINALRGWTELQLKTPPQQSKINHKS